MRKVKVSFIQNIYAASTPCSVSISLRLMTIDYWSIIRLFHTKDEQDATFVIIP
jgi:hypothetical protein